MASSLFTLVKQELLSEKKKKTLKSLVSIFGLLGLEKLLENSQYYNCPEEGYRLYGGMFLFAPALCLSLLSLLVRNSFWDSTTSCFRRKVDRMVVCRTVCHALVTSVLVGFVWLIIAFATTNYFVCFSLGGDYKNSPEFSKVQTLSSNLAWVMLVVSIVLAFLYNLIEKCCFSNSRKSTGTILRDYERIEAEAAISTFKKEAKALAQQEGERQVKDILHQVKDDKTTLEVVEEAKKWLIKKYSRSKGVKKDCRDNDLQLKEIEDKNYVDAETSLLYPTDK
jgi:hypothetical protein